MKQPTLSLLVLITILVPCTKTITSADAAPSPTSMPLQVDRLDPASAQIIPTNATLERLATGFTWLEGPVWAGDSLYFADIPANTIHRWNPTTGVSTFLHPSGYQGTTPFGGHEPGSNGMTLDARNCLTVAGHGQRDIYRIESFHPNAPITILADSYQGKRLNSPNDLIYKSDGSLYFTDPPYGLPTQQDNDPAKQLQVNGVYRIPHALQQRPGATPARAELQLLITDLPRPNGLAFSPDEKYLYVDDSQKKIWMRYTVQPDGTLTSPKLLYDASSDKRPGGPDGMKVDSRGNIYSSGPAGLWIFSPEGKPLATIHIPEVVANLAWGGPDRTTLYIAASTSLYRIHLKIPGEPSAHTR